MGWSLSQTDVVIVAHATVVGRYPQSFHCSITTWHEFIAIVNAIRGLHVLGSVKHDLPGGGFSGALLLGESHAAIHTWPEHNRAWVELASCGGRETIRDFVNALSNHPSFVIEPGAPAGV